MFTLCKDWPGQCIAYAAQVNRRITMLGVPLMPCKGDQGYCPLSYMWGAGWQRDQTVFQGHSGNFWSLYIPDPFQHIMHYRRFLQSLPKGIHSHLWVLGFLVWVAGLRCSSACATLPEQCKHCWTLWPCLCCVWDPSCCWAVTSVWWHWKGSGGCQGKFEGLMSRRCLPALGNGTGHAWFPWLDVLCGLEGCVFV